MPFQGQYILESTTYGTVARQAFFQQMIITQNLLPGIFATQQFYQIGENSKVSKNPGFQRDSA